MWPSWPILTLLAYSNPFINPLLHYTHHSKQGTAKAHGAPLGDEDLANTKKHYNFDPTKFFNIESDVAAHYKSVSAEVEAEKTRWMP